MSKHWRHLIIHSALTILATLFLGILPITENTSSTIYAESGTISNNWSIEQHPNYYHVEGKAQLDIKIFPNFIVQPKGSIRKVGKVLNLLQFPISITLYLMATAVLEKLMVLSQKI